jgi:hypothetical protein
LEFSRKPIAGVDALLSKPFQVEDLREAVTRIAVSRPAPTDESRRSQASSAGDHSGNGARDPLPSIV